MVHVYIADKKRQAMFIRRAFSRPEDLSDEAILERLPALNLERAGKGQDQT